MTRWRGSSQDRPEPRSIRDFGQVPLQSDVTKSRGALQLPPSGAGAAPGRASAGLGGVPIPKHAGQAFLGGRACGAAGGWSMPRASTPLYEPSPRGSAARASDTAMDDIYKAAVSASLRGSAGDGGDEMARGGFVVKFPKLR